MNKIMVCKFGGSSVANSQQIEKVKNIILLNKNRKVVVVSAPKGVTDNLILIAKNSINNVNYDLEFNKIKSIYDEIGINLNIKQITDLVLNELKERINYNIEDKLEYEDYIKAWGEYSNAKVIAEYFNKSNIKTIFQSPDDLGMYVTESFGNAKLLEESYENINKLIAKDKIVLFPGFYGKTKTNKYATFSRGGSDLTGAILAKAIHAKVYENWTDQDGIKSADPRIVNDPKKIDKLTYKEIRELAYMGFKVFHAEAMIPVMRANIPINIRNTNNPKNSGTLIVNERIVKKSNPIVGVASRNNFAIFNLEKILIEQEVGFGRRLLTIFEDNKIYFEHAPSGIDSISVIVDASQLTEELTNKLIKEIKLELNPDSITVDFNICLISCVGLGLKKTPGIVSKITSVLAKEKINLEIVNQGASEISVILGIDQKDSIKAVNAIYNKFF